MTHDHDPESTAAAGELYRLAQATKMLRLFHTTEGRPATTTQELAAWLKRHPEFRDKRHGRIVPDPADLDEVDRAHPDLAALARRSNPHLSW